MTFCTFATCELRLSLALLCNTDPAPRMGKATGGHRSQSLSLQVRYKLRGQFLQDLPDREKRLWFHSDPFLSYFGKKWTFIFGSVAFITNL